MTTRSDAMDALLKAQQVCLDLFDEIEANSMNVSVARIHELGRLIALLQDVRVEMARAAAMKMLTA